MASDATKTTRTAKINKINGFFTIYDNLCKKDLESFIKTKNEQTLTFKTLEENIKIMKTKFNKTELDKNVEVDETDLFTTLNSDEGEFLVPYYPFINEFVKKDTILNAQCNDATMCLEKLIYKDIKIQDCATGGKKRRNKSRKTGKKRSRKQTKKQRR